MAPDKKQKDSEHREAVLTDDKTKDIGICLSVTLATVSALTAFSGIVAVIALRALLRFRPEIGGYWMACLPFAFPCLTGIGVAFKRQSTAISLHVAITMTALLAGGSSYGYSIEPVFLENSNCTNIYPIGECDRPPLLYMYIAGGGAATGLCVLALILAFAACGSASNRRYARAHKQEVLMYQEQAEERLAKINAKRAEFSCPSHLAIISEKVPIGSDVIVPATNGVNGTANHAPTIDNITTRL